MKILGIDPGFSRMGWAMAEKTEKKEKLIEAGCIQTKAGQKHEARLLQLGLALETIIKKHKPAALAMEKLYFAKNQKTALAVAEARGVVLYLAGLHRLKVLEFAPSEIKMGLTGYGRADKNQIKKILKLILGTNDLPKLDDATDAIAIALIGLSRAYPDTNFDITH
ncbi:MAG: crossover junction endodeoxyribonuclease RuvC [Patescibacteria group bacterium]